MQDCRIVLETKQKHVRIHIEKVGMVELAMMCGALEQLTGLEALKRGRDLEDIKTHMLDIHLAAMQALTEQVIRERRQERGSTKADDKQGEAEKGSGQEGTAGEGHPSAG